MIRIIADENIPRGMIAALRENGHDVTAIGEGRPQASDETVLTLAVVERLVLLTSDADFGRMIFAEGHRAPTGIIYLRSPPPPPDVAIERVLRVAPADAPTIDGYVISIDRKGAVPSSSRKR